MGALYLSESPEEIQSLINKYNIQYIIIGDMERFKYGYDNSYLFNELGVPVFSYDTLTVYKVTPNSLG